MDKYQTIRGERVPKIGLGTWNLDGESCYRAGLAALEMGYRHIDTAEIYGNEEQVGRAMVDSGVDRSQIFLVTKVWHTHLRYEHVLSECAGSLRRLGVDQVDLYLVHWPAQSVPIEETMRAMVELLQQGMARCIGVSNFSVEQLEAAQAASGDRVFCNQVPYHIYESQSELLSYCQDHDVLLTAYSPLARGRVMREPVLKAIAERHGKTAAQVALRWLIQQDKVVAIPKSANPDRLQENLDVFDFELSPEEVARISALG